MQVRIAAYVALLMGSVVITHPSAAQVYRCNGVWTNVPCEGVNVATSSVAPSASVTTSVTPAASAPATVVSPTSTKVVNEPPYVERLSLYRKLKKDNEDYARDKKKTLTFAEIDEARVLCQDADTSYAQCQDKVDELRKQLAERNPADSVVISE
jgi:hypothetical protein